MAVPKRRTSKAVRDSRRAHCKLTAPNLATCPQCHKPRLPHQVCKSCGFYDGRRILAMKVDTKRI